MAEVGKAIAKGIRGTLKGATLVGLTYGIEPAMELVHQVESNYNSNPLFYDTLHQSLGDFGGVLSRSLDDIVIRGLVVAAGAGLYKLANYLVADRIK